MKFILPGAFFAFGSFFAVAVIVKLSVSWVLVIPVLIVVGFVIFQAMRLKKVSIDSEFVYVSNYRKEIKIPLSDINDVTGYVGLHMQPVTIQLRQRTPFGKNIVFLPHFSDLSLFNTHPVVSELKFLVSSRRAGQDYRSLT
ncbi:MAG: hypothetical protein KDB79_03780 [Acidobacteria bacterium]|nr:hypothetical protein [Acidobacteriota bacterium]